MVKEMVDNGVVADGVIASYDLMPRIEKTGGILLTSSESKYFKSSNGNKFEIADGSKLPSKSFSSYTIAGKSTNGTITLDGQPHTEGAITVTDSNSTFDFEIKVIARIPEQ